MLIYRRTSILESTAQTLVNTVNCVGVMGKGLAHSFKEREPNMFVAYKKICDQKMLVPGKLWLWRGSDSWILNFPTKMHWRGMSRIEWIEQGLDKFVSAFEAQGITEISFPMLGCGNGGLDWEDVRPVMERYLSKLPIDVFIHDYTVDVGLPEHLEHVAAAMRSEPTAANSFDGFMTSIDRIIALTDGNLTTLGTNDSFNAQMGSGRRLSIETRDSTWSFEEDDLRGVWLDLQNGLVTKKKAGWSVKDGGEPLVSILSVIPDIRPVEIQLAGSLTPEYAVEPRPQGRRFATATQTKQQHELSWH